MSVLGKPIAVCVVPSRVHEIWPSVSHFIKAAIRRGDFGRFDEIERDVLAGNALLWLAYTKPVIEAAAVTQIVNTEASRVCMLQACGGYKRERWLPLLEPIENYAKIQGCSAIRLIGRKGWARVLKDYQETKVVLERRL